MKKLLMISAAVLALAGPAHAEKTMTVPDNFKETLLNVQGVLERCIGAVTIGGDKSTCAALQNFIAQMAAQPLADAPKPASTPPNTVQGSAATPLPTPSPAPEAQKKSEDGAKP